MLPELWRWVALGMVVGCGAGGIEHRYEFRQPHMGTEFSILLYNNDESAARRAADAAFARIEELNRILSDYDPDSEAMRLCAKAGGEAVEVSRELFDVLERSVAMAERSQGAFDPTIGPVGRLWRRARRTRQMPDPADLARARELVDYKNIILEKEGHRVRLVKAGMKLDFGGIAKGYAADEALKVLRQNGVKRALVAAAGDIACGDPPPGAAGWKVGVAALEGVDLGQTSAPLLRLNSANVSTSGDAEQFVEINGTRYSHILDPRTGLGVVGRSSATVIAPDGATADALATAVSVLGPEQGIALVDQTQGAAALYVRVTDKGVEVTRSKRWDAVPKVEP